MVGRMQECNQPDNISFLKKKKNNIKSCRYLKLVDGFKRLRTVGKSFFKIIAVRYPEFR